MRRSGGGARDRTAPRSAPRRRFLQQSGALTIGFYLAPVAAPQTAQAQGHGTGVLPAPIGWKPNAFLHIGADSSVTVISPFLEEGQGIFTGLATVLADELDADWNVVRVEGASSDLARQIDAALTWQESLGSSAMGGAYQQLRQAGALARARLVTAAARVWNVPAESISVSNGILRHAASGRQAPFGALTGLAATVALPVTVPTKDPAQFKLIGNPWVRRKDSHAKTNGSALFTQDLKLPRMLVAVAAHPPRFGASVRQFDADAAKAIPGVVAVVGYSPAPQQSRVAVLARNTWVALRAREALQIEWQDSQSAPTDSAQISRRFRALAESSGTLARSVGDVDSLPTQGLQWVTATYEVPYLAHAAMEPMNCLVEITDQGVSIWNGEQLPTVDQDRLAQWLGIRPEQVQITQLYAGGSFGRRANPQSDYLIEAVAIARAASAQTGHVPIKLVWTRQNDMHAGFYRPTFVHRIAAALDEQGTLRGWRQHSVGQSTLAAGTDATAIEGSAEPYDIGQLRIELTTPTDIGVPVQWWRSAAHSHTAFATECMIDELAAAAEQDPYLFRRALLGSRPRPLAVLDLVISKSAWDTPLPSSPGRRRGRGLALHECGGTHVAQVAQVSISVDGNIQVDRVICAVDCGVAINPNVITAQMEGGIGFGLSAALFGAITLKDGQVQQADFDDYRMLNFAQMPAVEVYILSSHESPSGVADAGTPPIAAAVANAVFNATGQRLRRLPLAVARGDEGVGSAAVAPPPSS